MKGSEYSLFNLLEREIKKLILSRELKKIKVVKFCREKDYICNIEGSGKMRHFTVP